MEFAGQLHSNPVIVRMENPSENAEVVIFVHVRARRKESRDAHNGIGQYFGGRMLFRFPGRTNSEA
jgi:hypothetical protein